MSGVSPVLLDGLILSRTGRLLELAITADTGLLADLPAAEDVLYRLVAKLEKDRALRRVVLGLRRDIHNLRSPKVTPQCERAIAARLNEADRRFLFDWLTRFRSREADLARAEDLFESEVTAASRVLADALSDSEFQQGLALASSNFLENLLRGISETVPPGSRLGRTGLSYLTRAAVKTSPFSTFTQIGLAGFWPIAPGQKKDRSASFVTRALPFIFLRTLSRDTRTASAFRYRRSSAFVHAEGEWSALLAEYRVQEGFFWRDERNANPAAYANLLLRGRNLTEGTREEWLNAIGGGDASDVFARLVALSIIRPMAPWTRDEPSPLLSLALAVAALRDQYARRLAELLVEISDNAERVASAAPRARLCLLGSVRRGIREFFSATGFEAPPWLDRQPLVYEEVRIKDTISPLGDHVRQDLLDLGALMRSAIIRTSLYDRIVGAFVAEYGIGGKCADILGFLHRFLSSPGSMALLRQCHQEDIAAGDAGRDMIVRCPISEDGVRPTVTVFFQIAARSPQHVTDGDYLFVVNQYNPGHGGLLARALSIVAGKSDVLCAWIDSVHPGTKPVAFPLFSEWNNLQDQTVGDYRTLLWPTEWPTSEPLTEEIALGNALMVHDAASGTLQFYTREGDRIAPHYLGIVPPILLSGSLRLFLTLVDPWVNRHDGGMARTFFRTQPVSHAVQHSPRVTHGRIVLRRANWRVPRTLFPFMRKGENSFQYLERVARWRLSYNIPREVFARAEHGQLIFTPAKRKPSWLSFECFHALTNLHHLFDNSVTTICLEEALPSRHEHWLASSDGRPRASEWLALLRWEDAG